MSKKSEVIVNSECENNDKALKELIRNLSDNRRRKINSELAKGYSEMAEINVKLAEDGISSDNHALEICEQKLAECEYCDS